MGSSLITSHNINNISDSRNAKIVQIPSKRYVFNKNTIVTLDDDYSWVILVNVKYVSSTDYSTIDLILVMDGVIQSYDRFKFQYDYYDGDTFVQYAYENRSITATFSGHGMTSYVLGVTNPGPYVIVY